MNIKGKNKYGLKLEDFDSYKDYRKAYVNLKGSEFQKTEKGKLVRNKARIKYRKTKKWELTKEVYENSEEYKLHRRITGRFYRSKRRSAKIQRTVPWSNLKEIGNFYKACPKGFEVDHIIPLQGNNVSGLHVLNNLQYLTKSQNSSKGNRYEH